ncbi:hypothetical protein PYCC9005_005107 [Savitreella phatthalungensis]
MSNGASLHGKSLSLSVPSPTKGHKHRRSAAISFDWRNVQLQEADTTKMATTASPTLTFASTASESSLGGQSTSLCSRMSMPIAAVFASSDSVDSAEDGSRASSATTLKPRSRVTFSDELQEIPRGEEGDTWMKPEDYSWPIAEKSSRDDVDDAEAVPAVITLQALEPAQELAAPLAERTVPGSPVLHKHRRKRSSFLQTTKNVLSRKGTKGRASSPVLPMTMTTLMPNLPPPKSSMIDLDRAMSPDLALALPPTVRHKKSGSLYNLPPSPIKLRSKSTGSDKIHKRADSAPADIFFSFSPRPMSPDTRKRKMSAISEVPSSPATSSLHIARPSTAPCSHRLSLALQAHELDQITSLVASPVMSRQQSGHGFDGVGIDMRFYDANDEMIPGEPGDMLRDESYDASPALAALRALEDSRLSSSGAMSASMDSGNSRASTTDSIKTKDCSRRTGWKSVLHRLLRP